MGKPGWWNTFGITGGGINDIFLGKGVVRAGRVEMRTQGVTIWVIVIFNFDESNMY
jgi:hypothetical protein